jgi:DNA modification methylase
VDAAGKDRGFIHTMNMKYELHQGDCREVMATMANNSVDAIVTDPPYGLSFMGKGWDHGVPAEEFWAEALRVAKPGAHLLAFGGTRTFHRLACAIEDAGWEIRDTVGWIYGSGFPKSLDVSKAIDKAASAQREVVGVESHGKGSYSQAMSKQSGFRPYVKGLPSENNNGKHFITAPATDAAKQWAGYGTALKPAWEPVIVARKPLVGTVATNVLEYGTGAINVDACRIPLNGDYKSKANGRPSQTRLSDNYDPKLANQPDTVGRWPANIIHDGSDEVLALFPVTKSHGGGKASYGGVFGNGKTVTDNTAMQRFAGDTGSAARFFYCAKASKRDRDEGCEGMPPRQKVFNGQSDSPAGKAPGSVEDKFSTQPARNHHPTVKPTDLMRYLCRLVTPPDGVVLDPFMGSGSTGKAAMLEGFRFIGIEREAEYLEIAQARIKAVVLPLIEQE